MSSEHTPTPWTIDPISLLDIVGPEGDVAVTLCKQMNDLTIRTGTVGPETRETAFANAAFIVKAVNAHESMVETLLCILREAKNPESFKYDIQALASNMLSAIGRHPDAQS